MKRKQKPLWKKITGGTILLTKGGRRIKPKQLIRATEQELGNHMNHFERQFEGSESDQNNKNDDQPTTSESEGAYALESLGSGWFNVVSEEGEIMNDKKLRQDEAKELQESLNEEDDEADTE